MRFAIQATFEVITKPITTPISAAWFDLHSKKAINKNSFSWAHGVCQTWLGPHEDKTNTQTHFNTEIPSVNVVPQEKVACGCWWSSYFKKLHQVKELPMDVSTHWNEVERGTKAQQLFLQLRNNRWKPLYRTMEHVMVFVTLGKTYFSGHS